MKPTVYVETTIPSFYYESRTEASMIARKEWTRIWWNERSTAFNLFTSEAVVEEIQAGDFPGRNEALSLVKNIPLLEIRPPIDEIVEVYLRHGVMPQDPGGDALHLAVASYYRCDFLLTWNCAHLANANKFDNIRRINGILGLFSPSLVTPLELLGDEEPPP
ncbi:MAG: type II toxin-antitoxin system VapC family toxin [Candidatus Omnitrophica bacterium]|nr:type II toxin-antitoxin system VapC family toxin [Candidatus Omnitrophota bacterium]